MALHLCVVFVLLVALCNISTASLLSNSQTANATWVKLVPPSNIPADSGPEVIALLGIDYNIYLLANFMMQYPFGACQSYLYELNLQLELTATLNLTSLDPYSNVGVDGTFGNSNNKQIYLHSQNSLAQVDSTSMSIVTSVPFNGSIGNGFVNYEGTEVIFFAAFENEPGFLVLNASGLAMINFYPFSPPKGFKNFNPECTASNNEPNLAYCWSYESIFVHTFSLSLSTFKMVNHIRTESDEGEVIVVSYPGYSSKADLFIMDVYFVGKYYFLNLTGYTSDLNQVWQVELPSDISLVWGMISVGNSIVITYLTNTYYQKNILLEYDASSGQLIGQWTNPTSFDVAFYASLPAPVFESNGLWKVIGYVPCLTDDCPFLVDFEVTN